MPLYWSQSKETRDEYKINHKDCWSRNKLEVILLTDQIPLLCPMVNRISGIHVSAVINDLCIKLGHYKDTRDEDRNNGYLEVGNCFEWALINRQHIDSPGRYIIPGELEENGIHGTPDLIDTVDWVDEEIKATYMSSRHGPGSEKFWKYETQLKSYCYIMRMEIGRLRVLFIMGDYKGSGPQYRHWEYRFTKSELRENWLMIESHAGVM